MSDLLKYNTKITDLPVELLVMIFKMLDPESLVLACAAKQFWLDVSRADLVLHKRLKGYINELRQLVVEMIDNAQIALEVFGEEEISSESSADHARQLSRKIWNMYGPRRPKTCRRNCRRHHPYRRNYY